MVSDRVSDSRPLYAMRFLIFRERDVDNVATAGENESYVVRVGRSR
jgi:hypothetical protein